MSDEKEKEEKSDKKPEVKKPEEKKEATHIPLRLIRNDSEELEEDLREMFDEDKVVHRQGGSEPEAD